MIDHIKKYWPTYVPVAAAVMAVISQTSTGYLTTHPQATFGGLIGAIVLAVVNHWLPSPRA